jgi:hypothetical protein
VRSVLSSSSAFLTDYTLFEVGGLIALVSATPRS